MKLTKEQKIEIFQRFWEAYDKKVGRSKVLQKWLKLKDEDIELIMEHVPLYVKSTPEKQFRKNPLSYLNQEAWHDEIIFKNKPTIDKGFDTKVQDKLKKYG